MQREVRFVTRCYERVITFWKLCIQFRCISTALVERRSTAHRIFLLFICFCTARFCLTDRTRKLYARLTFKFIVSGSSISMGQDLRDTQEKCDKFDMTQNKVQKVQSCSVFRGGKANASLGRRSAGIFSSGNFIFLILFAFHRCIVKPVTRATANVRSKIARLVQVRDAMKKQREYVNATSGRWNACFLIEESYFENLYRFVGQFHTKEFPKCEV